MQPYPSVVIQSAWSVHSQAAVGAAAVGADVAAAVATAVGAAVAAHEPPPHMQQAVAGKTPFTSASDP